MVEEKNTNPVKDPDEIDLIALVKTTWQGRKTIIWSVIACMAIGVFIAFTSPDVYTVNTIMVPQIQSQDSRMGGLSSLAAMAGFSLNDMTKSTQDLSPLVYPEIVKSLPFHLEIMNAKYDFNGIASPLNLIQFYQDYYDPGILAAVKKYSIGLPGLLLKAIRPSKTPVASGKEIKLLTITPQERGIHNMLYGQLTLLVDSKNGFLTLTVEAPEAIATAQIAQKAQQVLQDRITEYKIDKAKQNLSFVQSRFDEKKREFEQSQERLARFRDRNLNLGSAMARTDEERLSGEYQIAFNVFSELAKQLENAKIKVKEETPVFAIIQPVSVPLERSSPKKAMIMIIWIFLGGIFGVGWVFGKQYLVNVRKKWAEVK